MQGLITLDLGNTNPHAGIFHKVSGNWSLIKVVPLNELTLYLSQMGMSAHNSSVVVAAVKPREDELARLQEQGFIMTRVRDYWRGQKFAGMPVHYTQTLGEDRLMEAFYQFKREKIPSLIINAGTFVTMDVVTHEGFQGGYIIPGLKAYQSSFLWGEQLKQIQLPETISWDLPRKTPDAMANSYSAFAALAKKLIQEHHLQKVLISGGFSSLWENFFTPPPSGVVVEVNPHLIHWALQFWMTTQIEPL
jgi:pantothenate kinase type III